MSLTLAIEELCRPAEMPGLCCGAFRLRPAAVSSKEGRRGFAVAGELPRLIVLAAFGPRFVKELVRFPPRGGSGAREDRLAILVMWRSSRAPRGDTAPNSSTLPPFGAAPKSRAEGHAADHIRQEARNGLRMDPSECRRAGVFRNPVAAPPALPETRRSRSGPSVKSDGGEDRCSSRCGDKFRDIPAEAGIPFSPCGRRWPGALRGVG